MSISLNIADQKLFNKAHLGESCIASAIYWQLAKRRSGSASTKTMSEISGTTAKPYKQKGTGHARQGSKRSVQFVGGRTCHGPRPRSYDFTFPKKMRSLALSQALSLKASEKKILVIDTVDVKKTSEFASALSDQKVFSALFLYTGEAKNLILSARNIKNIKPLAIDFINVHDVVKHDYLICDQGALSKLKELV